MACVFNDFSVCEWSVQNFCDGVSSEDGVRNGNLLSQSRLFSDKGTRKFAFCNVYFYPDRAYYSNVFNQ